MAITTYEAYLKAVLFLQFRQTVAMKERNALTAVGVSSRIAYELLEISMQEEARLSDEVGAYIRRVAGGNQ